MWTRWSSGRGNPPISVTRTCEYVSISLRVIRLDNDVVATRAIVGKHGKIKLTGMRKNIREMAVKLVRELSALWTLGKAVRWPHTRSRLTASCSALCCHVSRHHLLCAGTVLSLGP